MTTYRELLKDIEREVDPYAPLGVTYKWDTSQRYDAIVFSYRGETRRFILPTTRNFTVSNFRKVRNMVAQVRRELRAMGVFDAAIKDDTYRPQKGTKPPVRAPRTKPPAATLGDVFKEALELHKGEDSMRLKADVLCPDDIAKPNNGVRHPLPGIGDQPRLEPYEKPATEVPKAAAPQDAGEDADDKRRRMSTVHIKQLVRTYDRVGSYDEATKIYTFQEGWSDDRVRLSIDPSLPVESFVKWRRKEIGRTADEVRKGRVDKEAIALLKEQLAAAQDAIKLLEQRVSDLEAALTKPA